MLVQFKINKTLDKKLIHEFLNTFAGGVDFSKGIIRLHPDIKKVKGMDSDKKMRFISKYVNNYYSKNKTKINKKLSEIQNYWNEKEKTYFEEIRKVFGIKKPIQRKYVAYVSIINSCTRWISKKEFCVGYNLTITNNILVICHELVHFFFYYYMNKKYPKSLNNEQKWIYSEIFNVVILNKPQFKQLFEPLKEQGYHAHKKNFNKFQKLYDNSKDMNEFFRKSIQLAKNI